MKKTVLTLVFAIIFISNAFSNNVQVENSKINNIIISNEFTEELETANCFGFALAVYDAAMEYNDSGFAYDMVVSAFDVCVDAQ